MEEHLLGPQHISIAILRKIVFSSHHEEFQLAAFRWIEELLISAKTLN